MNKILIVEDEEVLLRVLKDRFVDAGWEVETAEDGIAAVKKIKKEDYDLILLDLVMPKKDGFEVLKEIKGDPAYTTLPIMVLSNLGGDEDIKKALQLGATDYYVKTQHPISEMLDKANKFRSKGA